MSIRIDRYWVVYETITMEAIDPAYLSITKADIKKYIKDNPMPKDKEYLEEDLITDLTNSSGTLILPDDIKEETRDYVAEMLNELIK